MKNLMKFKFAVLAIVSLSMFASCGSDSNVRDEAKEKLTTTVANPATPAATAAPANAAPAAPAGPTTTIKFEETDFDFGVVDQGEKVTHVYKFANTGNEPLIISNAKGSCGCTVPSWPKEPIPVGGSGEITVQFDSKGKKNKQSKRVTITSNTDPAESYLNIKGEVKAPEEDAAAKK